MATLRFIHRWLGLLLALPLLVQGLTGTVLTLEPVFEEVGRVPAAEVGSVNGAVQAALAAAPGMRVGRYSPPESAGEPMRLFLQPLDRPRGGGVLALVDPATATVVGTPAPPGGVLNWVKRLHENWLVPEWGGRQFAGWLGVGLVLLVVLGIPLWWPRGAWRGGFTVPRGATGALLQRRLHGALGGWTMVLLLATGVTGIVQGFPQTSRAVLGLESGRPGGGPGGGRGGGRGGAAAPLDLDAAIALARGVAPGLAVRLAFMPMGAEPIRVVMGKPGTDGVTTATTVQVDVGAKRVVSVQRPGEVSVAEATMRWARDLHVGEGFGPVWRWLTVATGVVLPAFGATGFLLWLLKRRNRARTRRMALDAALGGAGAGQSG